MGHKIGDAVRLRPGSDYRELLGDWADLTATIGSVDAEGERVALVFPEPFPCWTSALPAAEFLPDRAMAEAPF